MKNYHKIPYRGIFGKAAKILGFSGDNAARIASNKYRRGNGDVVTVVNKLAVKMEKKYERRIAELNEITDKEAV